MYEVVFIEDIKNPSQSVIHTPYINGDKLHSGVITQKINEIDSFQLEMTYENKAYGKLKPFLSHVIVVNLKTQDEEFRGRVLDFEDDMDANGLHTQLWMCESEEAYLHDSMQQHYEFRGTPFQLYTMQVNYHNTQVDDYQKFQVGKFEVTDPNDYMYVYLSAEETTFDSIYRTIINKLGGEMVVRRENGINYLDIVKRIGHDSDEEIAISRNLLSINKRVNPTEIITRLTPLGERIEAEDVEATDASQERLTIKSVNNNIPYLDRSDLIVQFGIRGGRQVWDDVTTPSILRTKGRSWLDNQKLVLNQYKIEALDLFNIGKSFESFKKGNSHPIINPVMALDERIRIIGRSIDVVEPINSSLTIGDKFKSLIDYQIEREAVEQRVGLLQSRLEGISRSNTQLRASIQTITTEIEQVQTDLLTLDVENLPVELQAINDQLENIGDAIAALPVYGLATPSEDGLMASLDKAKLDRIEVDSMVDLDAVTAELESLNQRLEALETPDEPQEPEPEGAE